MNEEVVERKILMGQCNSNHNIDYSSLKQAIFDANCDFPAPVQGPVFSEGYYISGNEIIFYCSPYSIDLAKLEEECAERCPNVFLDNNICEPEPCIEHDITPEPVSGYIYVKKNRKRNSCNRRCKCRI